MSFHKINTKKLDTWKTEKYWNHLVPKYEKKKKKKRQVGFFLFELNLNSFPAAACAALRRTQVWRC